MCFNRQLRQQLEEMQQLQEASRNSSRWSDEKLQVAEQSTEKAAERDSAVDDESALIIGNLREEIRAMEAEVNEARRLKAHVK